MGVCFIRNLRDRVPKKGQMLYDEVEFALMEELREPRYYFSLLQAISQGKRKLSEIVNATGINQPVASKYLGVLSDLKIVERELPVTEAKPLKSRKGLYRIIDEFFRQFGLEGSTFFKTGFRIKEWRWPRLCPDCCLAITRGGGCEQCGGVQLQSPGFAHALLDPLDVAAAHTLAAQSFYCGALV